MNAEVHVRLIIYFKSYIMGNLNEDFEKSSVGESKNIFNENEVFIKNTNFKNIRQT